VSSGNVARVRQSAGYTSDAAVEHTVHDQSRAAVGQSPIGFTVFAGHDLAGHDFVAQQPCGRGDDRCGKRRRFDRRDGRQIEAQR